MNLILNVDITSETIWNEMLNILSDHIERASQFQKEVLPLWLSILLKNRQGYALDICILKMELPTNLSQKSEKW